MKLFFGEFEADYNNYHFPYQVWLLREEGDDIGKIYDAGFLPIRNKPGVYYLSRNVRVDLEKFSLSSENKRILNKTVSFEYQLMSLGEFEYSPSVQKFCKIYMDSRFGRGQITATGIRNIFQKGVYNHVFVWRKKGETRPVGYAVCFINETLLQYAHAFYDLSETGVHIGIRMILQSVLWAHENKLKHAYLGTVYNESALSYKTEFTGVEFFNGFSWSANLVELKRLVARENDDYLLKDQDYLDSFWQGDLNALLSKNGTRVKL